MLKGLTLEVHGGEIHAIMGSNGTGKSTLASALMGHPKCEVTDGKVTLDADLNPNLYAERVCSRTNGIGSIITYNFSNSWWCRK
ncbi:ATP-binding cassette domain-containing protein [Shouchella clausii]|uniref:ATP-binding cassette domain-containing protein n=1 Tax=Shouchella clausii TaxID=79880 RepID=UPI0035C194E9